MFAYYRVCGSPEDRLAGLDIAGVLQRHSVVPLRTLMRIAAFLSAFYCVADYFWYAALANVSAAVGTAIFNCSPLFVYCFSICFLHERLSVKKLCGVFTSLVGVMLVIMFQGGNDTEAIGSTSVLAGLMMVISAALNAAYSVALALAAGEDMTDTPTLMILAGMCGMFTIPLWAVGSVLQAHSPFPSLYEPLGVPTTDDGALMLIVSVAMDGVNFAFWTLALCWTSPLETSVGCMLTIPLPGLMDAFLHHTSFSWEIPALHVAAFRNARGLATPGREEVQQSDRNPHDSARMPRGNGVVPVPSRPLPNERTKLIEQVDEDVELEKEAKEYFHTKHVGLIALFVFSYYRICGSVEDRQAGFDFVGVLQRHSVIPLHKLVRIAAFLGTFYLVADYFWFSALQHLSVAAGAAIFNSSPLFVYCFSICFLHEHFSLKKMSGVLMAFTGVILVIMFQGGSEADAVANTGVVAGLMMVISAVLNAGYNVSVVLSVGEDMTDTSTLMTLAGISAVFTLPLWAVGSLILAHSPFPSVYEPLGAPTTGQGVLMLAIGVIMYAVNFVFLTLALVWTSPLETSVGFMLTIPLSGLMDTLMHHTSFSWECIVGSALVMGGFCILEYSSSTPPLHHHHNEEKRADTSAFV
ncbi:hypothetical protein BBJ28_00016292 [Nothophytophthora sp. Chile5]|nr:hypothetical protein BBJ28_00016292 [Nothophytophthora sp. Chile5]